LIALTDRVVEIAWRELQVVGAGLRVFGETLRRDGVVLLRDCPSQRETPAAVLYEVVERLFRLPPERLLDFEVADPKNEGGYIRSGPWRGLLLPEGWHVVNEGRPPFRSGRPASVWPSELPRLRSVLLPYHARLTAAADTILSAVACFYERPADYFQRLRTGTEDVLRLLHYEAPPGEEAQAFAGHSDLSLVTLFPSATDSGLEREVEPGVWQALDVPDDGLLVGVGGALSVLTDGDIRPLQHRVRQLSESGVARRYSVSLFVNPRSDVEVTLLRESSARVGGEAEPRAQTFEAWFQERVRRAQDRGREGEPA
jgi:isopenicillin N synthase-like dioxygenase